MGAAVYRYPKTAPARKRGWLADDPAQHGEHYELGELPRVRRTASRQPRHW